MSSEAKDKTSKTKSAALNRRNMLLAGTTLAAASAMASSGRVQTAQAQAQPSAPSGKKPNILVIMGDDIGQSNISAYTFGLMGYRTPNIDRIAREGLMFTDYYAEQSCTAGRSSFITGQSVIRTGLSKVGIPGATIGLQAGDITIAEALKPLGYATGQFGKNHLGDRNEYLPTVHGFDEFFGNLYHLNAEEDPEDPDYPKDPAFKAKFGPRGVLRCKASDRDDPTVDPRFGKVGKQTIEDTGPLTKKRMETIDDETTAAAVDFIERQAKASKPFFVWMNTTRMHLYTHVRPSMRGQSGMPDNEYADGMIEHDGDVGKLLKTLDDLGISNDTIVLYTTDNGPHMLLARCGDDAIPQREGHQLGRCVPRAGDDPLARSRQAGDRRERHLRQSRLVPDAARRCRRYGCDAATAGRLDDRRSDLQGPHRRLQPNRLSDGPAGALRAARFHLFRR
jgi:arylsulfatase